MPSCSASRCMHTTYHILCAVSWGMKFQIVLINTTSGAPLDFSPSYGLIGLFAPLHGLTVGSGHLSLPRESLFLYRFEFLQTSLYSRLSYGLKKLVLQLVQLFLVFIVVAILYCDLLYSNWKENSQHDVIVLVELKIS